MASSENQVALITSAGRATGQEIALGRASEGTQMTLLARSPEQLDRVAAV